MSDSPVEIRPDANPEEEDEGGPVKPFLDHLEDLRWVLIKCGSAVLLSLMICLLAAPKLVAILQRPLTQSGAPITLQWLGPMDGIIASMKLALFGGIVFSLPFVLYFVGDFVLPALKKQEKRYIIRALIVGAGLFLAGVLLCYTFVLSISLKGMAAYNAWLGLPNEIWRAQDYFHFVTLLMLGMGASFEMPVVILTLVKLGVVKHEWLVKGRRYFIVINLVVWAFITPDFLSTFFLVIPSQILFEVCIVISAYWEKKKRLEEAQLAAPAPDHYPTGTD